MTIKKFAAVAVFAFAFAFAAVASAAVTANEIYSPASGFLRVGSGMGAQLSQMPNVMAAQKALNACTGSNLDLDGKFGPMTRGTFVSFQVSKGLAGDGVIGPLTAAQLSACSGAVAPVAQDLCPNGMTLASNCTASPASVGALCPNGMTLASNCMTAPGTGTSTTLTGTFGELLAPKKFTSGIEKTLREGRRENILGVELEAGKDSDLGISAVRLQFTHSGDGSNRLDQYFDEVSVLNGSTKVGSTNPGSFSRTGSISTGSITLSNVIVKKGEKLRLVVAGEVLNTIRSSSTASQDNISADWAVELTQVRYFDASGVFMTDGVTGVSDNLDFESSTAFDGLRVQSTGLNPISSNLKVKESSKSSEYEVFAFRLRGETDSSSVNVLEIPVNVAIFNPAAGVNNISSENVITDIWIKSSNGSLTFNDYDHTPITVANSATGNALYTFEIEEGDLRINSNTTLDLLVYVKFGSQNTKYDVGTTIQVSVDGSDLVVENIGGDGVNMSSAATITGNVHTTTLEAVNFTLKTPIVNVTSPQTGDNYITFIMPVEIDSDETLYILKDAGATDIGYTFSETGEAASFSTGVNQPNIVSAGGNDYFEVSGKKVIYFRVIFTGDSTNGSAVVVTLQLDTIEAATTAGGATTTYTLAPANAFDAEGILLI